MYSTHCESLLEQLSALHDGELSPLHAFRLRWHLRHCADCRKQMAAFQHMDTLLLAADVVTDAALKGRSAASEARLRGLQAQSRIFAHPRKRRVAIRFVSGLAVAGVAAFGLLYVPHQRKELSASAQVRRALANINTWHLKGWKIQNGERVLWEVWGQRKPFFYREQIGPDILVDNGTQRVSLYAPIQTQGEGIRPGVALIMPSSADAENVRWSYKRMVDHWTPDLWYRKQTPEGPVFNYKIGGYVNEGDGRDSMTDFICAVNQHTWLPRWYEIRRGKINETERQPTAHLEIAYDVPLPESVRKLPTTPADYVTYDSTKTPPDAGSESTVTKGGITVKLKALASDEEGNLLIQAQGWIGDTQVGNDSPLKLAISQYGDARYHFGNPMFPSPLCYNDSGRSYIEVQYLPIRTTAPDEDSELMLLTPIEPITQQMSFPRQIRINVLAALGMVSRFGGTLGTEDRQVIQQNMEIPLAIPSPGVSLAEYLDTYLVADKRKRMKGASSDLKLGPTLYEARWGYYLSQCDYGRGGWSKHAQITPRLCFWLEKNITATEASGVQHKRVQLASIYLGLGNRARAVQLLHDVLKETRFPHEASQQYYVEQCDEARQMLRHLGEAVK